MNQPANGASTAVLTADGRGAIAVVRIWGPDAVQVADAAFRPRRGRRLALSPRGRPRVGRIGASLGDEVVAILTRDEPPEVEVQCHGGPAAVALVLDALRGSGAIVVEAERWLARHGPARVTCEAALDLTRASTVAAAEILLDQADGALERDVRAALACLDADPETSARLLDTLIDRGRTGVRLVDGWRVVLAGRPNVGKSRLLNALAGYERAIVDATPGTTRDVVTVHTAIAGWPVELADTAGLRETDEPIESAGVELARARQRDADLVLLVLDGSESLRGEDHALVHAFPSALRIASKSDLPAAWDPGPLSALPTSAARGDGLALLVDAIGRRLVPVPVPPGVGVPFRPHHVQTLDRARELVSGGRPSAAREALEDLIAPAAPGLPGPGR